MKKLTIEKELKRLEKILFSKSNRSLAYSTDDWFDLIKPDPGVYGWFENGKLIYIGETGNLRKRIKDAFRTRNHSFRRHLGNDRLKHFKGFTIGTTKDNFPDKIERSLDKTMKKLEVSVVPIAFGRKEFEEYIYDKHKDSLTNIRGKRI